MLTTSGSGGVLRLVEFCSEVLNLQVVLSKKKKPVRQIWALVFQPTDWQFVYIDSRRPAVLNLPTPLLTAPLPLKHSLTDTQSLSLSQKNNIPWPLICQYHKQ